MYIFVSICHETITLSGSATSVKSILPIKPQRWCGFFFFVLKVFVSTFHTDTVIQCEGKSVFFIIIISLCADLHMHVKSSYAIFYGIEENKMTFTQVLNSGRFLCSEFSGGGGQAWESECLLITPLMPATARYSLIH